MFTKKKFKIPIILFFKYQTNNVEINVFLSLKLIVNSFICI